MIPCPPNGVLSRMTIPTPARPAARISFGIAMAVAALLCLQALPGMAEYTSVAVSNPYIRVVAGISGDAELGDARGGGSPEVAGKFAVGTSGGDPSSSLDNNSALLAGSDGESGSSLVPFGGSTYIVIDEETVILYGGEDGTWTKPPTLDPVTRVITDSFTPEEIPITISRTLKLLRDNVLVSFQITSDDLVAHTVGLVTVLDTEFGALEALPATGGPFYTTLTGSVSYERAFLGADVPDIIYAADRLPDYKIISQALLRRSDVTTPDAVQLVSLATATADPWGCEADPSVSLLTDSAMVLKWNEKALPAGGKLLPVSFYFGLGNACAEFSYPAVAALQTPFTLNYVRDIDDETGLVEDIGHIVPDPFVVYGYVYNLSPEVSLSGVQLQLTLPDGLEFATGESAIRSIGAIAPLQEGSVSWKVRATGLKTGPLPVTMSAVGSPMTGKAVTRTVDIPATETYLFRGGLGRWQMVTIPFETESTDLATALGLTTSQCPQSWLDSPLNFDDYGGTLSYHAFRWNPDGGGLSKYDRVTTVPLPGAAFWFRGCADLVLTMQGATPLLESDLQTRTIALRPGWNQIGNPWLYGVAWGRFRVLKDPAVGSVELKEAIRQRWVNGTLYWLNAETNDYDFSSAQSTVLQPWAGYWLRAYEPVTLIVPNVDTIGGAGVDISGGTGGGNNGGGGNGGDPPPPPLPPVPWSSSLMITD